MEYWPPFVVHGTHRLEQADINLQAHAYGQLLTAILHDRISRQERDSVQYLQELLPIPDAIQS
jgi:glutathione-regulated potassium-efflux system ancillary protein KefG